MNSLWDGLVNSIHGIILDFSKKLFDLKEIQALRSVKQGQDQTVAKSISYMQV